MARIKLSPLLSEISGKIGGFIFQKSKSGLILKTKNSTTKKRTEAQNKIRAINALLVNRWYSLSPDLKNRFNLATNFANLRQKKNQNIILTGREYFLKTNFYFLLYNLETLNIPVLRKMFLTPISCSLTFYNNILTIICDRNLDPENEFLIFAISKSTSKTINVLQSTYKFVVFETTATNQFNITEIYFSLFGQYPSLNSRLFFKYSIIDKLSGNILPFNFSTIDI